MDTQTLMEVIYQSTNDSFIYGILIGSLCTIAALAAFDGIKLARANCASKCAATCDSEMKKPVAKAAAKPASKKPTAKKPAAKKAAPKKKK